MRNSRMGGGMAAMSGGNAHDWGRFGGREQKCTNHSLCAGPGAYNGGGTTGVAGPGGVVILRPLRRNRQTF
jgi:hypothetical protein